MFHKYWIKTDSLIAKQTVCNEKSRSVKCSNLNSYFCFFNTVYVTNEKNMTSLNTVTISEFKRFKFGGLYHSCTHSARKAISYFTWNQNWFDLIEQLPIRHKKRRQYCGPLSKMLWVDGAKEDRNRQTDSYEKMNKCLWRNWTFNGTS